MNLVRTMAFILAGAVIGLGAGLALPTRAQDDTVDYWKGLAQRSEGQLAAVQLRLHQFESDAGDNEALKAELQALRETYVAPLLPAVEVNPQPAEIARLTRERDTAREQAIAVTYERDAAINQRNHAGEQVSELRGQLAAAMAQRALYPYECGAMYALVKNIQLEIRWTRPQSDFTVCLGNSYPVRQLPNDYPACKMLYGLIETAKPQIPMFHNAQYEDELRYLEWLQQRACSLDRAN